MKRQSSSTETPAVQPSYPTSAYPPSIRRVDMSRAKRVLDQDGTLPEPDECPALHAFLRGEEPSAQHFTQCLEWCVRHGYPDVVTSIQSAYPAFTVCIDTTPLHPGDAASTIDTITSHRIACALKLRVSNPAMSLHLARCLASPQCAIRELILVLPAWNRMTGGSLVAGLGSAVAGCPSMQCVSLIGPEDGGRCELETAFIEQAIPNALQSLRLGRGLAWHDNAWPELGTRILNQMLKRNHPGSMSLRLAEAYANAIALNGARSGSYTVQLGLCAACGFGRALQVEKAPDAKKCQRRGDDLLSLEHMVDRPADGWDVWLARERMSETGPQDGERVSFLSVDFPTIPDEDEEPVLLGFLSGAIPVVSAYLFANALSWCKDLACMDVLPAIQARYPLFTGALNSFEWETPQLAHDVGIAFNLNVVAGAKYVDIAIRILSLPRVTIRTVSFNWDLVQHNAASCLKEAIQAVVKAPSVVHVALDAGEHHDPTGESLALLLSSASIVKIEYANRSTRIDCAGLRPAVERALRGPLRMLDIDATDDFLRTIIEAIAATGSECRLASLRLRRKMADGRDIDLGMLFRGQQRISSLKLSASFASEYGIPRLADVIRCSPSITALEFVSDRYSDRDVQVANRQILEAVQSHLDANRHHHRYSEVWPSMLKSLVNFWSEGIDESHVIGDALEGVARYLSAKDICSLASTSRLLSSQFRVPKMEVIDQLIMSQEALVDDDLRWIVDQFRPPLLVDPRLPPLREGLTRIATAALSGGIRIVPRTERPRTAGHEVVDPELAAKVQSMVKDFNPLYLCNAVKLVLEGKRPDRYEFQACVAWCSESECMEIVAAIQERWPAFSDVMHLDGSEEYPIAILESILAHGIRCEVMVTITDEEQLADLEIALESPQPEMMLGEEMKVPEAKPKIVRTLGIVFRLEEMAVPESLAQKLAGAKLHGLCLTGRGGPVTLAPAFLPELLCSKSIEQLTLRGEFIAGDFAVDEARQWIEQSTLRSLHVQTDPLLVDKLGRAIVATDGRCRIVDLELLSSRKGEHPAFFWVKELLHPRLGISSLALDEEQLASLPPWQWQDVSKINHCLLDLRPVTTYFTRSVPSGVAAQMVARNQQIRAQVTGWALEMFMRQWARRSNLPVLINRGWMNQLLAYGDEPRSFDGLRGFNPATAGAARQATASLEVTRDANRIDRVLQRAALPGSGSLGVDRIVNHLRNRNYSLTSAQYARLQSAVVGRIERYLDRWQDGSLPRLDATAAT